jgi:hypothetical protein
VARPPLRCTAAIASERGRAHVEGVSTSRLESRIASQVGTFPLARALVDAAAAAIGHARPPASERAKGHCDCTTVRRTLKPAPRRVSITASDGCRCRCASGAPSCCNTPASATRSSTPRPPSAASTERRTYWRASARGAHARGRAAPPPTGRVQPRQRPTGCVVTSDPHGVVSSDVSSVCNVLEVRDA